MRRVVLLGMLVGLVVNGGAAGARPLVVFIGESTTWGLCNRPLTRWQFGRTVVPPERHLARLLRHAPADCPWRKARVVNYALPGTPTGIWSRGHPAGYCDYFEPGFNAALERACTLEVPVGQVLNEVLRKRHGRPGDVFLLTMGTNDAAWWDTPERTVDNIEALVKLLAPSRVLVAPPLPRSFPEPVDWPDRISRGRARAGHRLRA
jgi:hypothetical protein